MKRFLTAIVALAILLTVPLYAKGKVSTAKGTYKEWGGRIDHLEIVKGFEFDDYTKVVVSGFSTSGAEKPPKSENTYESVKTVSSNITGPFIEGMKEDLNGKKVERGKAKKGAIEIRGRVTVLDPGSRAKRYWGGFGAGAARVAISGEAIDSQGRVLFRFRQERRSGVGIAGGGYEALLNRNIRAIGEDVAYILKQF
jgi:hypothetical protein